MHVRTLLAGGAALLAATTLSGGAVMAADGADDSAQVQALTIQGPYARAAALIGPGADVQLYKQVELAHRVAPGTYCVEVHPDILLERAAIAVTPTDDGSGVPVIARVAAPATVLADNPCPTPEHSIAVTITEPDGTPRDSGFYVAIP
ncbi:hypothetical protein [Allostreptomyces psammosilenae]|uniref:Uncharacterized protein n=1 Tax=Allostreptomyces psammosilenae TaxID=1892865 RepID=A0A852ZVH7_9ACTN|nr:hypothetical protein [Allostreptomyces psammosilenae]NYI06386.1 hypothetical protein [Allostreptomyces psammosilenae]